MLKVALTGGIGSGKTAVSDYLETLGVTVLDADRYAHQVTAKGEDAVTEIANLLGPTVVDADGHLDRAAVRELVFADPKKRAALESIVHPRVRHEMNEAASRATGPYVILSIPLLIETGQAGNFDRVVALRPPVNFAPSGCLSEAVLTSRRSHPSTMLRQTIPIDATRQRTSLTMMAAWTLSMLRSTHCTTA